MDEARTRSNTGAADGVSGGGGYGLEAGCGGRGGRVFVWIRVESAGQWI